MVTEFCGTPAPQVVSQPAPPQLELWGFVYTKRPWRVTERVWEAFWDWSAPSAGGLGALRRGLFLARAPGVVERGGNRGSQIGSTLVEREGGGAASSSRPVNHSLLWRRGAGPLSPSMAGCGYLAGPSWVLRLEVGGGGGIEHLYPSPGPFWSQPELGYLLGGNLWQLENSWLPWGWGRGKKG